MAPAPGARPHSVSEEIRIRRFADFRAIGLYELAERAGIETLSFAVEHLLQQRVPQFFEDVLVPAFALELLRDPTGPSRCLVHLFEDAQMEIHERLQLVVVVASWHFCRWSIEVRRLPFDLLHEQADHLGVGNCEFVDLVHPVPEFRRWRERQQRPRQDIGKQPQRRSKHGYRNAEQSGLKLVHVRALRATPVSVRIAWRVALVQRRIRMKLKSTAWVLALVMCAAPIVALSMRLPPPPIIPIFLEATVPTTFGEWRKVDEVAQNIDPATKAMVESIYPETLSRTY